MIEKRKIIKAYVASSKPEEIFVDVVEKVNELKDGVQGLEKRIDEDLRTEQQILASVRRSPLFSDGKDGKPGKDGKDGKPGKDGKDGKHGKDGKPGSPDTPEDIVKKLKSLKGNKRLSVYDLQHWEDFRQAAIQWASANGGQNSGGSSCIQVREENVAASGSGENFTLNFIPLPNTLQLFRGGSRITVYGGDYTINGTAITLTSPLNTAQGETLSADYAH